MGMSEKEMKDLESIIKDSDYTVSARSTRFTNKLYFAMKDFVKENNIDLEVIRTMSKLNDKLLIMDKDKTKGISFVIFWWYSDAELAVIKKTDDVYKLITNEYLEFKNPTIDRDSDGISEDLTKGTIKYYAQEFDDHFDEIIKDMKDILLKMKEENDNENR